jgi:DNA-binding LytR/AlgR family response regulator
MSAESQSFANHRRWVPGYHFVVFPLLIINFGFAVGAAIRGPTTSTIVAVLTAYALMAVAAYARTFALTVQNRVIRLEERLRLEALLPDELGARVPEFSTKQLIGLRFAGDGEVAAIARRVLDEGIERPDDIKKLVTDWRADHLRV